MSFFSVVQRTRYLGLYNFQFVHLASGEPREGVNRKWERALRLKDEGVCERILRGKLDCIRRKELQ